MVAKFRKIYPTFGAGAASQNKRNRREFSVRFQPVKQCLYLLWIKSRAAIAVKIFNRDHDPSIHHFQISNEASKLV